MLWCQENRVDYVFGLARNPRLEAALAEQIAEAKQMHLTTGAPARVFRDFRYPTLARLLASTALIAATWLMGPVRARGGGETCRYGRKKPRGGCG
jgi:hypothetical protein